MESLLSTEERSDMFIQSLQVDLRVQAGFSTEYAKGRIYTLEFVLQHFKRFNKSVLLNCLTADYEAAENNPSEYVKGCAFQTNLIIQSMLIYFPELKEDDTKTT